MKKGKGGDLMSVAMVTAPEAKNQTTVNTPEQHIETLKQISILTIFAKKRCGFELNSLA